MTDTDNLPRTEIEARMATGLKRALKPQTKAGPAKAAKRRPTAPAQQTA
jgi:hypothetical protein